MLGGGREEEVGGAGFVEQQVFEVGLQEIMQILVADLFRSVRRLFQLPFHYFDY